MSRRRLLWVVLGGVVIMFAVLVGRFGTAPRTPSGLLDQPSSASNGGVSAAVRQQPGPATTVTHAPLLGEAGAGAVAGEPPGYYELFAGQGELTRPLEARWQAEKEDRRWLGFEGELQEALRGAVSEAHIEGTELISVSCRTTLCRTELKLGSPTRPTFMRVGQLAQAAKSMKGRSGRYRLEGDRAIMYTAPPGVPLDLVAASP